MTLRLYNTLTKSKDEFVPLDANNVRMYVCGPTVYDFAHIGNARPAIVFDVLFRLLRHEYGEPHVTYARNITDVDDKINARAAEVAAVKGISVEQARAEVTARTERQYVEDVTALGCLPPDKTPRATENIAPMIAVIEKLVAAGHAYAAEGHVLFDVSSKADYGKLSRRSLDEMIAGSRVEVAPYKKNPMDFVLWKPSDANTPGWNSPWGRGRPGWHIECSAMIAAELGPEQTIDIHGGGIDLVFPHHENEIAQSEGAHQGHALAKVWIHNGFLQVEGEKMSKSLGNFFTIRDLLEEDVFGGHAWPGEELRMAMLITHYRQPIDWTLDRLQEARSKLTRWLGPPSSRGLPEKGTVSGEFLSALKDDLNTVSAFSVLDDLAAKARAPNNRDSSKAANDLAASMAFLGIVNPNDFEVARANSEDMRSTIKAAMIGLSKEDIMRWVVERDAAKVAKNFAESDRIRDDLLAKGIVLKDGPQGTTWEIKR